MPATAFAQPKPAKPAAGKNQPPPPPPPPAAPPAPDQPVEPVGGAAAADEGGGLGDICKIDPTACPSIDLDKAAARDMNLEMYAVQQIYALRYHRVEINPYFGLTMNDQFVSHPGPGLGINFYILNTLAIGVNGNFYQGLNSVSAFNLETQRAARVGEPINEYQWNANANVTYVPAYGKFAGFGDFIFNYDGYIDGGVGLIRTKPIPIIDPDNRLFSWNNLINFDIGIGLRIFFNRWLSANLEFRDIMYFEKIESTTIATGPDVPVGAQGYNASSPTNPATWYDPNTHFTNDIQMQVGLSVFLPTSFEYALPK